MFYLGMVTFATPGLELSGAKLALEPLSLLTTFGLMISIIFWYVISQLVPLLLLALDQVNVQETFSRIL